MGHHASPGSGRTEFLTAVRPRLAIAQGTEVVSVPLFYPRPSYRIRRILGQQGALLMTTGDEGTVQVISDGDTLRWRTMARNVSEARVAHRPRDLTDPSFLPDPRVYLARAR